MSAATMLFAMAIGCVANWLRNRTLHCVITGPLFLIAALVFLLSDVTMTHLNSLLIWPLVLSGVGIAFLLEWRYTRLSASWL
jgi:VIT1/CCC1 family predicted Fe2+/Mn2+ transporter